MDSILPAQAQHSQHFESCNAGSCADQKHAISSSEIEFGILPHKVSLCHTCTAADGLEATGGCRGHRHKGICSRHIEASKRNLCACPCSM